MQYQCGFELFWVAFNPCTTMNKEKTSAKTTLRDEMPMVAGFIDDMRAAFGKEMIDGQIRSGMRGEPVFWASENGREIGTPIEHGRPVGWDPVTLVAIDLDNEESK